MTDEQAAILQGMRERYVANMARAKRALGAEAFQDMVSDQPPKFRSLLEQAGLIAPSSEAQQREDE